MANTFCRLVSIPSPSQSELGVATHIKRRLDSLGVDNYFDGAANYTKSDTGNLVAKIGNGRPSLMFVAHMDTVEDGKQRISPRVKGGVIKSAGKTILGADDKAGVTALLGAISELHKTADIPATTFVFTTTEEGGDAAMGASHIGIKEQIDFTFSVDGSDRPGMFMHQALGTMMFEVEIKGKQAHAEIRPEKGANAVKAASI
ncbi:MAG: M20/M25/M40 family metallo-hydrolase, partial [Candidatus Micrarchaeota archaeon]|nr:M20/M25/M40 family metallo-hydrolase [Candidatus Micrarchaeota archaeon]